MIDVLAEELENENEYEMKNETPQKGLGLGATKRLTPLSFPGVSAGGEGVITNDFSVDDKKELSEMKT